MRTNREHVTMDGNEAKLLDRYEAQFRPTEIQATDDGCNPKQSSLQ